MKIKWTFSVAALGALVMLAAARPAAGSPTSGSAGANSSLSACLQACLRQFQQNVSQCKKVCWVCDYSVLGLCLEGHHDEECLRYCKDLARGVQDACAAACHP